MTTRAIAMIAVLWAVPGFAQTSPDDPPTVPPPHLEVSGDLATGLLQVDNSTGSSKLTEYRDIRNGWYLPGVGMSARDGRTGRFIDVRGVNLNRLDRTLLVAGGQLAKWNVRADWTELPHTLSNKAVTPYTQTSPGVLTVPATVPITFKKLGTAAADTSGVLASDTLIAAYQASFLKPTPLGTQSKVGHVELGWSGWQALSLGMTYDRRAQSGSKSTFGPIGDRPPRTLNIQIAEPVEYRTNDVTLAAEHKGSGYQVRGEYALSEFENRIDTLQWQNIYTTAAPGADFDVWDRLVATSGARPLAPDNRFHNITASGGIDLPAESRMNATVGLGRLEQNASLLPYAFQANALPNQALPRATAEASIHTRNLAFDYVVAPVRRLNVRAFYRQYDLSNNTPSDQWQYVTSDTANLNGTVSYVNKRVNLPFAWDRQNAGVEATWRLPARTSLAIAYEREDVGRDFREADTSEQVLRLSWRTRPAKWLSMKARYTHASRDGGIYNGTVTREGYWYAASDANDANNPQFTFDNHPDMRRYDVSDRVRRQGDLTVNVTTSDYFAVSGYVRYRDDDYDSGVASTQPLLNTTLPDRLAATPGDQLGRLKDSRLRYGIDVYSEPRVGLTLNAFVNYDRGSSFDRSIEFNENNKQNPSAVATAELGPWTRAESQWTADARDRTWSGGGGARVQVVPEGVALLLDYTLSLARVDIAYDGYGVRNFNGAPFAANHQFGFSTPPPVIEDMHVVGLRVEIPIKMAAILVGYAFESYDLDDWQQGSDLPWVESVGAPTLLRDTSRSFQWGNRLFNLGTYLAPSYRAHIGTVSLRYRF